MWGPVAIALAVASLPSGILVQAQSTQHAQCVAGFEWSFNSKNQSPCQISEFLGGVCNGGVFTVPPLTEDQVYRGPDPSAANSCRCSMAFYAMTSTCAACQTRSWVNWSQYSSNCTQVYVGFPQSIPSGTSIPHYAYQNFTSTDKFDIVIAQSASGPESVAPSGTGGSPRPTGSSSGGGGGSNAGAIAGGVVGGVVGLAIIAGLAFWFIRRRNARRNAGPAVNLNADPLVPTTAPMSYVPSHGYPSTPPPKIYDPSDPSTFPTSPANTTSDVYTMSSNLPSFGYTQSPPPIQSSPQPAVPRPNYYSGAPEV